MTKIKAYYKGNGRFQWMLDELQAAGIEIKGARTYNAYHYNNRRPNIKHFNDPSKNPEEVLEKWADANILEAYAKFLRK